MPSSEAKPQQHEVMPNSERVKAELIREMMTNWKQLEDLGLRENLRWFFS
jgi:hypothetical protein